MPQLRTLIRPGLVPSPDRRRYCRAFDTELSVRCTRTLASCRSLLLARHNPVLVRSKKENPLLALLLKILRLLSCTPTELCKRNTASPSQSTAVPIRWNAEYDTDQFILNFRQLTSTLKAFITLRKAKKNTISLRTFL